MEFRNACPTLYRYCDSGKHTWAKLVTVRTGKCKLHKKFCQTVHHIEKNSEDTNLIKMAQDVDQCWCTNTDSSLTEYKLSNSHIRGCEGYCLVGCDAL